MSTALHHRSARHEQPGRALAAVALGLAVSVALLGGALLAGEALDDPGGAAGVALVLAWAVPLAALTALARHRPVTAERVLAALVAGLWAIAVAAALWPDAARSLEDGHGPLRTVASFVLLVPLGVLGRTRPLRAGALLLAAALGPLALGALGGLGQPGASALAAALPLALVGLVLVVAAAADRR